MKDFYSNTRVAIDKYNQVIDKIRTCEDEPTESEDEFLQNFCLHLAHALISDTGTGQLAREELCRVADIIKDVII